MLMVGNVLGLLWLDEKPLQSETATLPCLYSPQSLGLQKKNELGEKSHSATALGCAMRGYIQLVFPANLQLS